MSTFFTALVFMAALLLGVGLTQRLETAGSGAALRRRLSRIQSAGSGLAAAAPRPSATQRLWRHVTDRILARTSRWGHLGLSEELAQKLIWSGLEIEADRFGATRLVTTGLGAVLLAFLFTAMAHSVTALFPTALIGAGLGWIGPDVWLTSKVKARQAQVQKELPMFLDLLGTALEAGLGFNQAIGHVQRELPGILPAEFGRALLLAEAGGRLDEAFTYMASRLGVADVETVVETMLRSRQYGARLARDLTDLSQTLRRERVAQAEEKANRAGTFIVLPLALFVLPVTLLIIGYPAFSGLTQSLFHAG